MVNTQQPPQENKMGRRSQLSKLLSSIPLLGKLLISALLLTALILILITQLPRSHHRPSPKPHHPPSPPPPPKPTPLDPNTTIQFDFTPYLRLYKNGRVERLSGTKIVSTGLDITTGVTSKDVVINSTTGLSARLYLPKLNTTNKEEKIPILVFIHGGAFVIESPFSPTYHDYLNVLVAKARVVAVSVNYRRVPEHWLPVAYNDSFEAYKWVVSNSNFGREKWLSKYGDLNRLYLAGDSAGGNIAHNVAIMDGVDAIKGLALLNPYFWGKKRVGNETVDPIVRRKMEVTWEFVCNGRYDIDHPFVNPMGSPSVWKNLSSERVLVTLSELDTFKERGKAYVEGLENSGWKGEVEMYETKGEDHVYFLYHLKSDKAVKEMAYVVSFLNSS